MSLWMLPFQLSLPTERNGAHKIRQCHWKVHLQCEIHEASSLTTSTIIAPERIFFTAHWSADAALIRSRKSKIFNCEKDVNGLSLLTGSITRKRSQCMRDFTVKVFNIRLLNMHFHFNAGELLFLNQFYRISLWVAFSLMPSLDPSIGEHQNPT